MAAPEVEFLFQQARAAIESGQPVPAEFLIPVGPRRWRVQAQDLAKAGQNDLGIPPRAFAYGAVGMLLGSLGGSVAYAMEAPGGSLPPDLAPAVAGEQAGRQGVVVTVFARASLQVHMLPFSRDPSGAVAWGEPLMRSTGDPKALGAAVPLWRAVNREPTTLPPPGGLIDDMIDSGFSVIAE